MFFEFTTNLGESTLTPSTEFKFIVFLELNKIESVLVLNNNLPEFNIICSPANLSGDVGALLYEL